MKKAVVFIGSAAAVAECAAVAAARAGGHDVVVQKVDPAMLGGGWLGRFLARRRLRRAAASAGADSLVCLVERSGDVAWKPWMVYAAGSGLRPIAAPVRMKGLENVGGVRSGVAVYTRLETAADLAEVHRAALAEVQKLAVAARAGL